MEYKGVVVLKTILLVNGAMNFGGAEVMIMDIVRKLHKDFRFVFLINRKKGTQPVAVFDEKIKSLNIPIYYIDAVWDVGVKEYERQFRNIINKIGTVDIIHSHLNSKGGIISRCAYKCGIKRRIVHSHAQIVFDGSLIRRIANILELKIQRHWIKKYATDFWGCSDEAMLSLFNSKQIKSKRSKIIHNAIDLDRFLNCTDGGLRNELKLESSEIIIGSIGRIVPVKNYRLASEVIKELWRRGVDVHYVVAGEKQNTVESNYLFDALSFDKRFHYLDVRSDVQNLYKDFDIYLGTSKREGLGLSVVEAQASGTNCVVSAGFPKLCDIGVGLVNFVDSTDPVQWADKIEYMLNNKVVLNKNDIANAVKNAGFDIINESNRLKELYDLD